MAIAMTLRRYLAERGIEYDLVTHAPTFSASRSAQASNVSGDRTAKAVVLKSRGGYVMAVLPASHHIEMDALVDRLGEGVDSATEDEIGTVFADCEMGAVPAAGPAYGMGVVMDESLEEQAELYFEGGDHTTLVHVKGDQFRKLMGAAEHARFSRHD